MKRTSDILRSSLIFFFLALLVNVSFAQTKQEKKAAKAAQVKEMVESKKYVFIAQSAMPMGGRTLQLTSLYTLAVKPDSLICDLPYFGRSYQAPMGSSDNGIKFISTDFDYSATPAKKGGWKVVMNTKGQITERLTLSISSSGYASLQVASSNARQSISFSGVVEQKPK